jgi:hemerythrin
MTEIRWDARFGTGNAEIDTEHQVLVGLIRRIAEAHAAGSAPDRLRRLLDQLRLYAEFHFVSEENLMLDAGYPQVTEHKEEHQHLMNRLRTRLNEYLFDVVELGVLLDFLYDWFAQHISETDRELAQFIDGAG